MMNNSLFDFDCEEFQAVLRILNPAKYLSIAHFDVDRLVLHTRFAI